MNKSIRYQGSRINYSIHGKGKHVMLIHGFGEDSSIWNDQISFLQNDLQLIVPDLPGSGASELLQQENTSITHHAEVISAILSEENIDKVIMIGHSMGGYITLAFAEKYPDKLTAFGLFHSGAYADDAEKIETRKKAISFIEQNGSVAFLKTSTPGLFFDTEKSKTQIDLLIDKGSSFLPEALIGYYNAMIDRPDRTQVLRSFLRPVLFIIGEHDKAIPFKHSMQQAHLPAVAHIHILRNSAHLGMLEERDNTNEILAQFLHSA